MSYSFIIPLFRRYDEIAVLLQSMKPQTNKNFEVIIVEDISEYSQKIYDAIAPFKQYLNIKHFKTSKLGAGIARNFGMERAKGDYYIFLDSDVILDEDYLEQVDLFLKDNYVDCYGGPEKLYPNSNIFQKSFDYCLTSFFTTGGIRGNKTRVDNFYPRTINMGVSKDVFAATGGFKMAWMGEDVEFGKRIVAGGFKIALIDKAYVYHKRKDSIRGFCNQMHRIGMSRVNIYDLHSDSLSLIHFVPLLFCWYFLCIIAVFFLDLGIFILYLVPISVYFTFVFFDSFIRSRNLLVGIVSVVSTFCLLIFHGLGLVEGFFWRIFNRDKFMKKMQR